MIAQRHSSARDWLDRVSPLLLQHEVENNLMLGLAGVAAATPEKFPRGCRMWTVEDGGCLAAAAINTPPHNLVLTRCSESAIGAIIADLVQHQEFLPGVIGPDPVPAHFAERWASRTGVVVRRKMEQRIHECRRVITPSAGGGHPRAAAPADADLLAQWWMAFNHDVQSTFDPADAVPSVRGMIERRVLLLWEHDGVVVSCANVARRTPHGCAVAFVYTPPEHRRRGYATSCVAALTQRQLDAGAEFCCLYTDLANPTSNAIYARIGYRPVCDSEWWEFV
jgi:predicted GNAT family acetyltransferase